MFSSVTMKDKLTILFLGADGGNAVKRARALRRLGHDVRLIDPYSLFPLEKFGGKINLLWRGIID